MIKKAGGVILKDNNVYLVSKDKKLQFPKGHVEKGESILACAEREVKEETGFKNLLLLDKKPIINKYQFNDDLGKQQSVEMHIYIFGLESNKRSNTLWMVVERLTGKWVNLNKAIEKTQFDNVKKVLKQVKDRFGTWNWNGNFTWVDDPGDYTRCNKIIV